MDTTNWNQKSKDSLTDFHRRQYEVFVEWTEKYGGDSEIDQGLKDTIAFDRDTAYCRYALLRDERPEGV